jgi:hypothetical protein
MHIRSRGMVILAQHYERLIHWKANQELLEALKDEINIGWPSHFNVFVSKFQLDAQILSLGRHMIKKGT